jgi:succinate dehydrogenase/fumarate reductase flavoprotein subunit
MVEMPRDTDVLVVGSGMAGLVSAFRALEFGARVTVLEKGSRVGGKTYLSDGAIIVDTDGEPQLPFVEPIEDALGWLEDYGIDLHELERQWGEGQSIQGKEVDARAFVRRMAEMIESQGGSIHLNTAMDELRIGENGRISGAVAYDSENERVEIDSDAVILCTGGFGGNEQLIERYITDEAKNLLLRADPWSTGDGFLSAQEVGGKTTDGLSKFDGHSMIAPPASFPPQEYVEATQYYGPRSIALDWEGERFVDESLTDLEQKLIQAVAERADGRSVYVIDQTLYDTTWVGGHIGSMVERAKEYGGDVIEARDLSELHSELRMWGVDGDTALETIRAFNEGVSSGSDAPLDPPRERFRDPIDEPPFYAVKVKPGIHFTMGGLDITDKCQVIRRSSSGSTMYSCPPDPEHDVNEYPIEGLYAVGIDAGNPHPSHYIGALSRSLIGGRIAGKHAAEHTKVVGGCPDT